MSHLRIGLAQVNPTAGALAANQALILDRARSAAEQGAQLVAFGLLALTGSGTADLTKRTSFQTAVTTAVTQLADDLASAGLGETVVVFGGSAVNERGRPFECIFVLHRGSVLAMLEVPGWAHTHDCAAKPASFSFEVAGKQVLLTTSPGPAVADHEGVDLLLALDCEVYVEGTPVSNQTHRARSAQQAKTALAYVNLAGGQDGLVFTGGSDLTSASGTTVVRAPLFTDSLQTVDVPNRDDVQTQVPEGTRTVEANAEIYQAIVVGLRDYVTKNGFQSVVLGLSGGIDSALLAVIAADAIGGSNIVGVSMPSAYSSEHSQVDAADLAERVGARFITHPIESMVDLFTDALDLQGVAQENLQARVRGLILMGLSNSHGHLVLAPGNKSELAVGYSTIYGDAVGGYAPLKDVYKSRVWELARWRNNTALDAGEIPPIPESSITKPPSAELRPGQVDQDSLPPYDVLDAILKAYLEDHHGRDELITQGFDAEVIDKVIALVDRAEWKRRQYPIGPKLTRVAFGADHNMPITNGWRETDPTLNENQPTPRSQHDAS